MACLRNSCTGFELEHYKSSRGTRPFFFLFFFPSIEVSRLQSILVIQRFIFFEAQSSIATRSIIASNCLLLSSKHRHITFPSLRSITIDKHRSKHLHSRPQKNKMSNTNSFGTSKPDGLNVPANGVLNPLLVQRVKEMIIHKMMEDPPNKYTHRTVTVGDITITTINRPGWKPQVSVTCTSAQVVTIPVVSFGCRTKTDKSKPDKNKMMKASKSINPFSFALTYLHSMCSVLSPKGQKPKLTRPDLKSSRHNNPPRRPRRKGQRLLRLPRGVRF